MFCDNLLKSNTIRRKSMNDDSDEEISKLRAEALLTRPSNMRKRKVTLINSRNTITGENDGDKRQILARSRTVVVGSKTASPIQSQKIRITPSKSDDYSDSHWPRAVMDTIESYTPKKPKLKIERRVLSVNEKQVNSGKDQRIFTVGREKKKEEKVSLFEPEEEINFDTDVRIILSDDNDNGLSAEDDVDKDNELMEFADKDGNTIELDESISVDERVTNEDAEDVTFLEERLPLRKVEKKNSEERTETDEVDVEREEEEEEIEEDEEGQDESKEIQDLEECNEKQEEPGLEEQDQEESKEKEDKGAKEKEGVSVSKQDKGGSVSRREPKNKEKLNEQSAKDRKTIQTTNEKVENKNSKNETSKSEEKEKSGGSEKNQKTTEKTRTSKEHEQNKSDPAADDNSDDESSGSESDSSHSSGSSSSSSSSSNSSSSSSSRTSSSSRSSSGSKSDSDSDDGQKSRSKQSSRSASRSRRSSSYSYSTGGSADKTTMRSVVSQKDKDLRQRRSPRRSPRGRWSPRDRRFSDRRQSYDSDDRYSRDRRNGRIRRDDSPRYARRRSPHSRLGRRNPNPPSFSRGYRERSRERDRPRDTRFNRSDERPRRKRTRSKSLERRKDSASDKNNLSRTDDDFVEIDVRQKPSARESRPKSSGRREEKRVSTNARESGFDLRSKLGPKKTETKIVIAKANLVDARQKIKRKAQQVIEIVDDKEEKVGEEEQDVEEIYVEDDEQNGEDEEYEPFVRKAVVEVQDNKEAQLDAKILRIHKMNEEIRQRQEEIEREKLFYG